MKPLLVAAAIAVVVPPLQAQNGDRRTERVDSIFAQYDKPGSPGAAVVVVRDGGIVFEKGYGYASIEHDIRITPSTVFDLASVSKQFAGLAIAMLVDQGRVRLDDDVRKYIPELHNFGNTITIDHLLHHTSGIRDWPGTLGIAGWRMDDVISFDQILRFAYTQRTLNFVPGAEYTYSNTGYNLLAEVVARVTKKSFRAWTNENLFQPLGMKDTHFHDDHTMIVANRAFGYGRNAAGFTATPNNLTALGSSSLYSTARDLAKWVANFDDAKVGGRKAMELTRTTAPLNSGAPNSYAFGIGHGQHLGQPIVSHSGGWAGFSTFVVHYPRQRTGVIVLANTGMNTQRAAFTIASVFMPELGPERPSQPAMATAAEVTVPSATLDRYVGTYKLGPAWYVVIRRDGSRLLTRATNEPEHPLSPRGEREFWVAGYDAAMGFLRDSVKGTVSMFYRGRVIPRLSDRDPGAGKSVADLAGEYVSSELGTSYTVEVKDTVVSLRHWRHGPIGLRRVWGDDYSASQFFMRSVEFQRDSAGHVHGFVVNAGDRVRNVFFARAR
jgi:CubicO group peptidase (beta-lactamase class C family)